MTEDEAYRIYNVDYKEEVKYPPKKVGLIKHYPVIVRVRYYIELFPFNRGLS